MRVRAAKVLLAPGVYRCFGDPIDVLKTSRDGTPRQMRALYAHLAETQGTKIERFALGSRKQFRPGDAAACRDFKVFNLCANGRFVRPDDTTCRLADRSLYDGPRLMLPTYMPLNRPQTPAGRGYLSDVARCAIDQPCHVVLDVPPGGES